MSVVGFDIGNSSSVVALAQKRGIDVLLNQEAKRETPSAVYFGEEQRCMGGVAASKQNMYPRNTVTHLKRLIGKTFSSPDLQADLKRFPFTVLEGQRGGCLVQVNYSNQTTTFSPEQLVAMYLVHLKQLVTKETNVGVTDCVISVPAYFTERERHAMLDATRIAGVNCLRLMDDTAATALCYGIFKSDLPEENPVYVAFVDMGHTALQVCVVALKKGQLQVLSSCWDRNLGGRDYDEALFEHFGEEFKQKTKLDVHESPKACFRLRSGCEKVKKMLSANSEAICNVECLMEDTDFSARINRDKFEELTQSLTDRVLAPCQRAVEEAKISIDQVSSVEVIGSSSRIPAVQKVIEEFFKKPVSRTLNAKECIARGCALQCAMLSPIFRVKEFEISNCQPYAVAFKFEKDGKETSSVAFDRNSLYPAAKLLPFFRTEPFAITAYYSEEKLLPPNEDPTIGCYEIGPFIVPKGEDKAKIKVTVRINLHGLLEIVSVHSIEEEEIEVPVEVKTEEKGENGSEEQESEPKTEKKIKTRKYEVPFEVKTDTGLDEKSLNDYFELEGKMGAQDKLYEETQEKKNAVESYVYSFRSRLSGDLAEFAKPTESEKILKELEATEDWLYDKGENETKSVYVKKLEELNKMGAPIELRFTEWEARPKAAQILNQTCDNFSAMATSDVEEYRHIEQEEKDKVIKECQTAVAWLHEKLQMQQQLLKTDDPVVLSSDIMKKQEVVHRFCEPIMSKPKPVPPKKEAKIEPKEEAKKDPKEEVEKQPEEEKTGEQDPEAMDTTE